MAQTSHLPPQRVNPIVVVSPNFMASSPVDLVIAKKFSFSGGDFTVSDNNKNLMFKVEGKFMSLRGRRVLLDAAGNPIMSYQQKAFSFHSRWVALRGDSSDSKDKIFSVKRSSFIQFKTSLSVFLVNNKEERFCDFKIKGSWFERSCTIYAGDGTTIIAKMHKKHTVKSILLGKDRFNVTVYPNVDHAFVVALIVILYEINKPSSSSSSSSSSNTG